MDIGRQIKTHGLIAHSVPRQPVGYDEAQEVIPGFKPLANLTEVSEPAMQLSLDLKRSVYHCQDFEPFTMLGGKFAKSLRESGGRPDLDATCG